ncbi:MAG: hypothetical protein A3F72_11330 [Bacteroidetes bacterium RIFCSPLOWO2_12_FULL_35_15]|nr:MAG: hypothetical protein A3F72_11330 [Bacteroidetes bacterium RIFCSPLOWO2_12_FULL_35_15]
MNYKYFLSLFFLLLICTLFSQNTSTNPSLDHNKFIEELSNSQKTIFDNVIKEYDDYLLKHSDDVLIQIEKCKFIQFAQYDDEEDYNPHQDLFDSCTLALSKHYPNNPDVFVFQTTYLYGDDLKETFEKAKISIQETSETWSKANLGQMHFQMATHYYSDSEYEKAYTFMVKACFYDKQYKASLDYVRILIELKKKDEALAVLKGNKDTTKDIWQLSQKAKLFIKLEDYSDALKLYNSITQLDSSFNNNEEMAKAMENIKEYALARKYLVADTLKNWNPDEASLRLFLYDMQYQNGDSCIGSYCAYRAYGYSSDPLAIYRLRLFFKHPFLPWKMHDMLGLLTLLLFIIVLILIPSIWILPVYFIGHKWKIIDQIKTNEFSWGLKSFWWISSGYLIAIFAAQLINPEHINSLVARTRYSSSISSEEEGARFLLFISVAAFFGFTALYKVDLKVLTSKYWKFGKNIAITVACFVVFKIISGIYLQIGIKFFDVKIDELTSIPNILLSARADIDALLANYGNGVGFLIVGFVGPCFEEIFFRGVILDSCKRYLNFNFANIIQSALFATVHYNLFLFPVFFSFGILTGILTKRSGGMLSGIVFHIINNILAIAVMIAMAHK